MKKSMKSQAVRPTAHPRTAGHTGQVVARRRKRRRKCPKQVIKTNVLVSHAYSSTNQKTNLAIAAITEVPSDPIQEEITHSPPVVVQQETIVQENFDNPHADKDKVSVSSSSSSSSGGSKKGKKKKKGLSKRKFSLQSLFLPNHNFQVKKKCSIS